MRLRREFFGHESGHALMERRLVVVKRDCPARLVPTGTPVMVPGGTFVTLTQTLGGTYTIVFNGNMARIDGADADALGFKVDVPQLRSQCRRQHQSWIRCTKRCGRSTTRRLP